MAGGYLLFFGLILADHVASEEFLAAPAQLPGAALVAAALVVGSLHLGRRPHLPIARPAPNRWLVATHSLKLIWGETPARARATSSGTG